ncbi:MAG: S-methyl-5-thioribose-1-phosphate isomerase [Thermodesulfobacteriota bacterium]
MGKEIRTVFWKDGAVVMIDQRALPLLERHVTCTDYHEVVAAIKNLTIRGAPAIGVAAAMGIALGVRRLPDASPAAIRNAFTEICKQFAATRPTARNLFWAIERMRRCFDETLAHLPGQDEESCLPAAASSRLSERFASGPQSRAENMLSLSQGGDSRALRDEVPVGQEAARSLRLIREALITEAIRIGEEDIAINRRLGRNGCALIPDGARILTHCNAGALATAGYGTALGVIRAAREEGKKLHVYVDETRPVLQGARLTAWELMREAIPCTLIADNMAGFLMQRGEVDLVIVGADRIAANGDTANKIGTYTIAVLARAHGIPLYIAAPLSTIDPSLADGGLIPIEERDPAELTHCGGVRTAPEGISVWNPAFDVTPHDLITAIVTEAGVIRPPFAEGIRNSWPSPA